MIYYYILLKMKEAMVHYQWRDREQKSYLLKKQF